MLVVGIQTRTILAGSSLSENTDGTLTGSLFEDVAGEDGMAKGVTDINIWEDEW